MQQQEFQKPLDPSTTSGSQTPSVQSGTTYKSVSSVRRVSVAPAFDIADDLRPFDVHIYSMEECDSEAGSIFMVSACNDRICISGLTCTCVDLCDCIGSACACVSGHGDAAFQICDMSATISMVSGPMLAMRVGAQIAMCAFSESAYADIRMLCDSDCSATQLLVSPRSQAS